jgi:Protein of unknown function (DUF3592)
MFALVPVVLLVVRQQLGKRNRARVATWQPAHGVVVSRPAGSEQAGTTAAKKIVVEYRDAHGRVHRATSIGASSSFPQVGAAAPVFYNPHNPADARIDADMKNSGSVLLILAAVFGVTSLALAAGLTLMYVFDDDFVESLEYELVNTGTPPGDPSAFRPFKHLPKIAAFAGKGAKLIKIEATAVPTSGKLDLGAKVGDKMSSVKVEFVVEPSERDRRDMHRQTDRAAVSVDVRKPHVTYVSTSGDDRGTEHFDKGMIRSVQSLLRQTERSINVAKLPKCSAEKFWKVAIAKGAPKEPARIRYDVKGYEFSTYKKGNPWTLLFGHDCQLIAPEKR